MELLCNGALLMTRREFEALPNYSGSLPTGVVPGKKWRRAVNYHRQGLSDPWLKGMYGKPYPEGHEYHGHVPVHWQPIVVAGVPAAFPRDITVPPPQMRGRITAYPPTPRELAEGLFRGWDGQLRFDCIVCGYPSVLLCDPQDFDPDMAYCGGSPRCCP